MTALSVSETLTIIFIVSACTVFTRVVPFLLLGKKDLPPAFTYLGEYLPMAVIAVLVIYCFKNTEFAQSPHGAPELIAVAVTAALHYWKRNNLISIGGGTVLYMLLVQAVFK